MLYAVPLTKLHFFVQLVECVTHPLFLGSLQFHYRYGFRHIVRTKSSSSSVLPILHGARQGGVRQDSDRRIIANPPLESLLGGVRQDSDSRLTSYPLLERVTGSAVKTSLELRECAANLGSVALPPTRSLRAWSVGRDTKAFIASLPTHSLRECLVARDQTLLHTGVCDINRGTLVRMRRDGAEHESVTIPVFR